MALFVLGAGCGDNDGSPDAAPQVADVPDAPIEEAPELPLDVPTEVDSGPLMKPASDIGPAVPEPPQLTGKAPQRIAARHILIAYEGAVQAPPQLRRSRGEAVRMAEQVRSELQAGADFASLAKDRSDDSSANRGGQLGGFERGRMVPVFERAAFALRVGELSDIVESEFGLHVIERMPLVEVRLGHVLVQWDGVRRSAVTRTQDDARLIAEDARARLLAGEPLADVAAALSDGDSGPRGGDLGWFQRSHTQAAFRSVFDMKRGEVGSIIETAYGFHVLVRLQ